MKTLILFLAILGTFAQSSAFAVDEADYHNTIRDALSFGQTLNNLGDLYTFGPLDQSYNFALQNQPASPLAHFSISSALQTSAADYASECKLTHSGGIYGENLFAGTGALSIERAVNTWANEAQHLSYPIGASVVSCQTGEQCGHYTQMVWSGTTQVGCAAQACTTITDGINTLFSGNAGTMIVCHYNPAGNVSPDGISVYAPYIGQSSTSGGGNGTGGGAGSIIPPIQLLLLD